MEKATKQLEGYLLEANTKLSESQKDLNEVVNQKNRLAAENTELNRKLQDQDSQLSQLSRVRQLLAKQLEEMKAAMEDDSKLYGKIATENKNLQSAIQKLEEQLDDEQEARTELQKQLSKSVNECGALRQKADALEAAINPEEMEELKRKMVAKIQESESQLETALTKALSLDKAKVKLQAEVESLNSELDKVKWNV